MNGIYVKGKNLQHEINRIMSVATIDGLSTAKAKADLLDDLNLIDQDTYGMIRNHLEAVEISARKDV